MLRVAWPRLRVGRRSAPTPSLSTRSSTRLSFSSPSSPPRPLRPLRPLCSTSSVFPSPLPVSLRVPPSSSDSSEFRLLFRMPNHERRIPRIPFDSPLLFPAPHSPFPTPDSRSPRLVHAYHRLGAHQSVRLFGRFPDSRKKSSRTLSPRATPSAALSYLAI